MAKFTQDLRLLPYLVFFVSLIVPGCAAHTSETAFQIKDHGQTDTFSATNGVAEGFGERSPNKLKNLCSTPILGNFPYAHEEFSSMQAAVNDPDADDYDVIWVTAADFDEDVLYDRDAILYLSGGWLCDYENNPSTSSVKSLTIKNGTFVVKNIVIQ